MEINRLVTIFSVKRRRKETTMNIKSLKIFCSVIDWRAIILYDFSDHELVKCMRYGTRIAKERKRDELYRIDISPHFGNICRHRIVAMKSYSRDQAKSEMGDVEKPESDGRELFTKYCCQARGARSIEDLTHIGFEITSSPQKWHSCPLYLSITFQSSLSHF